jgi:hypothetical protein
MSHKKDAGQAPAPRIRRSAISRFPVGRRALSPYPRGGRWRSLLPLLLLGLLPLIAALAYLSGLGGPSSLPRSTLAGSRLVTGPICVEEAVDVSGSLTDYAAPRDQAEIELFEFARRTLRRDDLFSESFFAASGRLALAPAPLAAISAPPAQPSGLDPDHTYIAPAVQALITARPAGERCAVRALVMITDGLIEDPGPLAAALTQGGYTRVFAVVPVATGTGRPAPLSGGALNAITVYHFTTSSGPAAWLSGVFRQAQPLDVVLGDVISVLTGQRLVRT